MGAVGVFFCMEINRGPVGFPHICPSREDGCMHI